MLIGINQSMRTWVFPVLAGLTPLLTDGSKVILPYLTGGGLVAAGVSQGGLSTFTAPTPGKWSIVNQPLIGAAAVVTAIGAVAGGIALVNNSAPNSAVISADSQLEAAPAPGLTEDAGAINDILVDSPHNNVAPNRSASSFKVPLTPVPMPPFAVETFEAESVNEGDLNRLLPGGHTNPTGAEGDPQEKDARTSGLTLGQSLALFSASPSQSATATTPVASASESPAGAESVETESSGRPVSSVSPSASGGAYSPDPQPTSSGSSSVDYPFPTRPVTPTIPVLPVIPSDSITPIVSAKPVTPTVPASPVSPSHPGTPTAPSEPEVPDPLTWVGTPEYYDWMSRVPWHTIGAPVGDNRMCTITYIGLGSPVRFGTYIPPIILDSPYAFYVLESYYGLLKITDIKCY